MIDGKRVLGLIPARGGSKRLPRKNVLPLAGKPLIAYTVEAALQSQFIDSVAVSTDDPEIAAVARRYGAQLPFTRPAELASDEANNFDVIQHAINYYALKENTNFDYIVYLQPTSPLRTHADIDAAFNLLRQKGADAVISVCEPPHSPLWCNTLPADLSMKGFLRDDVKYKRSQELERYYQLNGAIYIISTMRLLREKTFFIESNVFAYVMPLETSIDIDTFIDFNLCEILLRQREL